MQYQGMMSEQFARFQPTLRLSPSIPAAEEPNATLEAEQSDYIDFDEDTETYRVTYPIPTRRVSGVKAMLENRCTAIKDIIEFDKDVAETDLRAEVPDAISAFAVLEAIYTALGYCRVCGEADCMRGHIFTEETVMHRDTAESVLKPSTEKSS